MINKKINNSYFDFTKSAVCLWFPLASYITGSNLIMDVVISIV